MNLQHLIKIFTNNFYTQSRQHLIKIFTNNFYTQSSTFTQIREKKENEAMILCRNVVQIKLKKKNCWICILKISFVTSRDVFDVTNRSRKFGLKLIETVSAVRSTMQRPMG